MGLKCNMLIRVVSIVLLAAVITGCASVVSKDTLSEVSREVTPNAVQADPERFIGSKVVWGGIIISSENLEQSTVIEVFQTELSSTDRPKKAPPKGPGSRFLIESPGFLDTVIYKPDTGITVAGIVEGVKTGKIGKMDYPYPIVKPLEMHLFDMTEYEYEDVPPFWYYPPPFPPYYDPYWPYYRNPYWPYYPYY